VSRNNGARTRIVVEKPIGTDLKSACAINDAIAEVFDEPQIYGSTTTWARKPSRTSW
jgi:glucose-6-phosphate 1-dehydrogenase